MTLLDLAALDAAEKPELVFGIVAPVGTAAVFFADEILKSALAARAYEVEVVRVSDFLQGLNIETPPVTGTSEFQRVSTLMDRGNRLREATIGGALSLFVASTINAQRPADGPASQMKGKAFVLHQLKHPDEVEWLRRIYGSAFHLVGVYCPRAKRFERLTVDRGMTEDEARQVISRDEGEIAPSGQQLRNSFHLADLFVEFHGHDDKESAESKVERFLDLLFGTRILTPTLKEYGMFLAHAAAMRSADLSRQVGAAILTGDGEVLSLGTNDVPRYGGGLYWPGKGDARDFVRGFDSNEIRKRETLREILEKIEPKWDELGEAERDELLKSRTAQLSTTRVMNLTEFGRAVHAEMEAISASVRIGVSLKGATLFTTTFPCHNCAKHIVASGLKRVIYVEPYPKSLALDLHGDSIALDEDGAEPTDDRVWFERFIGVSPRRYVQLFSTVTEEGRRLKRKDAEGYLKMDSFGLRLSSLPYSYVEREAIAAAVAKELGEISLTE